MTSVIETGDGNAGEFIAATRQELSAALGFRPFPGTLNVDRLELLEDLPSTTVTTEGLVNEHCDGVIFRPCSIGGVRSAVLRPLVSNYPDDKIEVVAPVRLRSLFDLNDGDDVNISRPDDVWHPNGPVTTGTTLDEFDAVVFDLDGTLVDLGVDWPRVHEGIEDLLGDTLNRPLPEYTRSEVMKLARESGSYAELDAFLTDHEVEGAKSASKLSLLEKLTAIKRPVGICTANARSAAEYVLKSHGLYGAVDALVARDTVPEQKPHPRPLEYCIERLNADPGNTVFVGDEQSDAETAVATGSSFLHPDQIR